MLRLQTIEGQIRDIWVMVERDFAVGLQPHETVTHGLLVWLPSSEVGCWTRWTFAAPIQQGFAHVFIIAPGCRCL